MKAAIGELLKQGAKKAKQFQVPGQPKVPGLHGKVKPPRAQFNINAVKKKV